MDLRLRGLRSFIFGLSIMLASLTFGAIIIFNSSLTYGKLPLQIGLLKMLHDTYSFLLTPLSSALGASSLGGRVPVGIWPLILWIMSSVFIGFMVREPGKCAKIVFTSASFIFIFWIFSNYLLFSLWNDTQVWLSEVDKLMSDLLVHRPLDIIFFLTVPPIISASISAMITMISKEVSKEDTEIKEDEQYQLW